MKNVATKNFVALPQFDGATKILKIELDAGNRKVVAVSEIDDSKISFGMFEFEEDRGESELVALLATINGPLLFLGDVQYSPKLGKTTIEIRDDEKFSHFLVLHEKQKIFGMFYEKKFGIGLHPYNRERDDIDFYFWLSKKVIDPKFYKVYSRDFILIE